MQSTSSSERSELRRNFALIALNGTAFGLVDTLVKPELVLVVFLAQITNNPVILGLPVALWKGGFMLSQLTVTGYVQRSRKAMPIYKITSLIRMMLWLGLVLMTMFVTDANWLIVTLVAFLIGYPLMWGVAGLAFYEVVSKTIPPRLRGPVFSARNVGSGVLALLGSWYVNRILALDSGLAFPRNFALIFATAASVTSIGLLFFHAIREPESESVTPHAGLRGRWQDVVGIWQGDSLFRHFVAVRVALLLAGATAPLVIVYAQARFDLPLSTAGAFLVVDTVTTLLAVIAGGWISARWGNRALALIAVVLGGLAFGLVVIAGALNMPASFIFGYFVVVFVMLAAFTGASNVVFSALLLNIAPEDQRPLYIGFANTIFGVASYVSIIHGVLAGWIGYQGVFIFAVGLVIVALWQGVFYLQDPTDGQREPHAHA